MAAETREAMLNELADYASPSLLRRIAADGTDAEIRDVLAGAKAQAEVYRQCGFEDMAKAG